MEFNGQYLTYTEYKELGGAIPDEMPFNLLEFNARKCIDKYTFGRLINLTSQVQEVKLCVFELIEKLQGYSTNDGKSNIGNIASESIDGYSIAYNTNIDLVLKSKASDIADTINTYLAACKLEDGTPYLYRG